MMKYLDKVTRKDGTWKKGRYATVICEPNENGEIFMRFGSMGKYFAGWAKDYIVIEER